MSQKSFPLSDDPWEQDVWLMSRRAALMYYYMAKAIVDRLGEAEGKDLIRKAIWEYGEACGRGVKEGILEQGLSLTPDNYGKVPDLPSRGWHGEDVVLPNGEKKRASTFCPLAEVWKQLEAGHPGAEALGRLYCLVDQAKYHAFNPELEAKHTRNVLDGDPYCIIDVERK